MRYVSTAGRAPAVDLATAVVAGLAPDGGLYLPERLPRLPAALFAPAPAASLADTAQAVLAPFLEELPEAAWRRAVAAALDFETPLVELGDGVYVLELFHGPTLAFKDVGARFLARLLPLLVPLDERAVTVLVATSGDTGSAVAHAFHGVAGTRVAVLYPRGKVSPLQERQLTTLGGNVRAIAVEGSFDDCQRLVKEAFGDRELRRRLRLTSANSINLGRLLPQIVYYVHAVRQLPAGAPPPLFATPSGNFGNLTAGLMARRMGLPCRRFVAATNVNDVVPVYLASGRFTPQPSQATISNAMDVGDPSNLARIRSLYGDDLAALRRDLAGRSFTDEETRRAIRAVYDATGYVLDPHSAVGYLGLTAERAAAGGAAPGIVLATAHPVKFREHVEPLVGRPIAVPERLARALARPPRLQPLARPELRLLRALLIPPRSEVAGGAAGGADEVGDEGRAGDLR